MNSIKHSLTATLSALSLLACGEDPYGSTPETAYRIEGTCTEEQPWCDDEFDECYASGAQACNTCYQIGGLGCASYCDYAETCRNRHCGANEGCLTWGFTATLGDQDPAIFETCQMASARAVACGEASYPAGTCELYAATERTEASGIYECVASTPCGEDRACDNSEPDNDLSHLVCDALATCGSTWESCDNGSLAAWLGWLRHDVKRGLRGCAELPECSARPTCVQTWIESLTTL
ncbi:MAG: hypothetical protein IPI43_14635 [Sandaracinaceae bacterium]|nr:hypothetical protein [Sandaracinaceae bacterium]